MMDDYKMCPRYFKYRHIEYLTSKDDASNFKAAFGTAIHSALETWYKGIQAGISSDDKELKDKAIASFKESWNPYEGADEKFLRTMARGEAICRLYFEKFKDDPKQFKILHTEIGGSFELGEYIVLMKSDMVIENSQGIGIFETKTSAYRNYLIVKPNTQIDTYMSGHRILKGLPVSFAILNQIYYRKGKAKETILETTEFVREQTNRSDKELDEWKRDTLHLANTINKSCSEDRFPMNTKACTNYGGCMFLNICKIGDGATRESLKRTLYKEEKWEPWKGARG